MNKFTAGSNDKKKDSEKVKPRLIKSNFLNGPSF